MTSRPIAAREWKCDNCGAKHLAPGKMRTVPAGWTSHAVERVPDPGQLLKDDKTARILHFCPTCSCKSKDVAICTS
jgi:hypothetical protein